MKNIIFIAMLLLLSACSDEGPSEAFNIDTGVGFYVLDENGNDLLDPMNANSINTDNIEIYHIIGQDTILFNKPNRDAPRGFTIYPPEGDVYTKYRMWMGVNIEDPDEQTTMLIKWSETDTDTLNAQLARGDNFVICTKIWVNGEVAWSVDGEGSGNDRRFFAIVK